MQPVLAADLSAQVLAVLEHRQCAEDQSRAVRPLFVWEAKRWRALKLTDKAPAGPTTWFLAGTGSTDHAIVADAPPPAPTEAWRFSRDYYLKTSSPLPAARNAEEQFGGWCAAPANRPLPLASQRVSAPSRPALRPVPTSPDSHPALLRALLASYRATRLCANPTPDSDKAAPFTPKSADLVVHTSLEVEPGLRLVALTLRRPAFDCRSELGASDFPRWFAVGKGTRYLGASLHYVDVVFASPEGKPDLLFWYSGYNEDGYVLLSSTLSKRAQFTWHYH